MRTVSSIASMQRLAKKWRREAVKIGLVPTMGYLHAGHLSLVRESRRRIGKSGRLVVSIYVNPTQFAPTEDFSKYPRDLKSDIKLLREAGVDVVFAPSDREMYPERRDTPSGYSTYVSEEKLSRGMEGSSRPAHFRGVTTVVAKLFNIVQPEFAIFGRKDFQQAAIIQRMARDLNFPVRVVVSPTVREADGLAMSSRNKYLKGDLRRQATVLRRALDAARAAVKRQKSISAMALKATIKRLVEAEPDARMDYVEFFEPETLTPAATVSAGTQMALAVFVGETRLIDNDRL